MANRAKIAKSELETAALKFMSIVSDDLLLEIFVRLIDPRSAIRCSVVCKRWFSLIFCSQFIHNFIHHHDRQRSLPFTVVSNLLPLRRIFSEKPKIRGGKILYGNSCWISQLLFKKSKSGTLFGNPVEKYGKILASFNDLLLVSYTEKDYYICNPLTRQCVALPESPIDKAAKFSGLVFEPNSCSKQVKCNCTIGRRFRVLLVPYHGGSPVMFCSEIGKWSLTYLPFDFWKFSKTVASNGIFYFLAKGTKLITLDAFKDIDHPERCRSIDLPVLAGHGNIGVVGNQVRLVELDWFPELDWFGYSTGFTLKIWELNYNNDDAASWVLGHEVSKKEEQLGRTTCEVSFHPDNIDLIFIHSIHPGIGRHYNTRYNIKRDRFDNFYCSPGTGSCVTLVHPVWPTILSPRRTS